jgi:hypothetical protein
VIASKCYASEADTVTLADSLKPACARRVIHAPYAAELSLD